MRRGRKPTDYTKEYIDTVMYPKFLEKQKEANRAGYVTLSYDKAQFGSIVGGMLQSGGTNLPPSKIIKNIVRDSYAYSYDLVRRYAKGKGFSAKSWMIEQATNVYGENFDKPYDPKSAQALKIRTMMFDYFLEKSGNDYDIAAAEYHEEYD